MLWRGKNESHYVHELFVWKTQYINRRFRYNPSTWRYSINFAIGKMIPNTYHVYDDGKANVQNG